MTPFAPSVVARRYIRWLCLGLVLSVTAGCFDLSKRPVTQVRYYNLEPNAPEPAATSLPVNLQVLPFRIAAAYDRDLIVYRPRPFSLSTYFYHRWASGPARLVTEALTRDLTAAHEYRTVEATPSILPADYFLSGTVDSIEELAETTGCVAHLEIRVILSRAREASRPMAIQSRYDVREPSPCNAPEALAGAMSRALATASSQIRREVREAIAADMKPATR